MSRGISNRTATRTKLSAEPMPCQSTTRNRGRNEGHEAYYLVAKDMVNHDHPEARGANPMNCARLPDWKHNIVNKHQHSRKQSQEQEQHHKQRITTASHGIKPSPASKLINY